jgi:plastocyanin
MKKILIGLVLVVAALGLTACGSSDDETTGGGAETSSESGAEAGGGAAEGKSAGSGAAVSFEADPSGNLAYTANSATAKAGKVTVDFTNPQAVPHDVAIEDSGGETLGETETIAEGSDSTTVDLKPGKYTFFCTVPGHREAGMEGTLTVK